MNLLIYQLFLILLCFSYRIPQEQIPQTFGLNTVTYTRAGSIQQFQKYLAQYAFMDCPILSQINIVWNNQKSPEQMGVFRNSDQWKRPVNFYLTSKNSLNWRFKTAKESKALVYFSIDDDIVISCRQLARGFRIWQQNAAGSIGPIIAYEPRCFEYTNQGGFKYKLQKDRYFNFGMVSFSFINRHFMELYYADIWEVNQVRKLIAEKQNCEDMALEWIAEYFYPQFQTIVIEGNVKDTAPPVGVSTGPDHFAKRDACLHEFTDIFGSLVLKYKPITDKFPDVKRWSFPFIDTFSLIKKQYLDREVLHKDTNQINNAQYSLRAFVEGEEEKMNVQTFDLYKKQLQDYKNINKQLYKKIAEESAEKVYLKQKLNEALLRNNQPQQQISHGRSSVTKSIKSDLLGGSLSSDSSSNLSMVSKKVLFYSIVGVLTVLGLLLLKNILGKKTAIEYQDPIQKIRMIDTKQSNQKIGKVSGFSRINSD